ncbi:MAG: shikimate dehydrogenase [Verrucomicrobiota bacterium]
MSEEKDVYTLADLKDWPSASKGLPHPATLAVIGDPVEHSRSPQMHNPGLRKAGIDAQYVRIHLSPEELKEGLSLMKNAGFQGTNVTIPHKGGVFEAVDEMTEVARRSGAVNTVVFDGDEMLGHNTDGPGLRRAIREKFSIDLTDLRILILGAGGGAGKAAAVQCAMDHCDRLVLANRTVEKAEALQKELQELFIDPDRLEGPADRLVAIPWDEKSLERELGQIDLVINATSVGMKRTDPELVPPRLIEPHHLIYDMIYAPPRTRLMNDAEAAGARAANGLGMLLWQGVLAFEFWFNEEAPVDVMREGLESSLS